MAAADASKYEDRKAFWRRVNSNGFGYGYLSNLEAILENLSSEEITGQLEKCKSDYIREKLASSILQNISNSENKEISQKYSKNIESLLSALNNYEEPAAFYLTSDNTVGEALEVNSDEKKTKNFISFLSNPEIVRTINKFVGKNTFSRGCFTLSDYLDFSDERSISVYTNFILALDAFSEKDEDGAEMLIDVNEKTYRLFGPEKSAGIFAYLAKRKDKTAIRKINSLDDIGREEDGEIRKFLDNITLQNFGVKKAERLINLAYFLGIAANNHIKIRKGSDLNLAYDNALNAIKKYFSKKYAIQDSSKIERLSYWLKEFDSQIAYILSGKKVYKKGPGRSYVLSKRDDIVLYLKPSDLETQMEALQNITSCLSPGGDFFKHTRDYLKNPYIFWAVVKAKGKVVGRATICMCRKASDLYTNPQISSAYSLCRLSEIRSDVKVSDKTVDSALRKYAKEQGMRFIKKGNIFVEKLDDIYDDYVYANREYKGGVIAELND